MDKLNYYMGLPYEISLVPEEEFGGYITFIHDLPGCISRGDTPGDAVNNIKEAQKEWLTVALEDGFSIKEPHSTDYSGNLRLRMPKTLHRDLAVAAKQEGVSMNQYCNYAIQLAIHQ